MLKPFLDYIQESVVVGDGAMGTQLYAKGIFLNRCFDELNLSRPALVGEVHQEYLWAGAEILETNTFGANRLKLEQHGLAEKVREINHAGVRIAKDVAGHSAYVGGSVGPLGVRVEPFGTMSESAAKEIFAEQIMALAEAGADLICLETFADLNEIHAALLAAKEVCSLPVMAQMSLEEDGNSLDGSPPETFGCRLEEWGADVVGMNCGVGPQVMLESLERLAKAASCFLVVQPNAGRPRNFEGRNLYLCSPDYMASYTKRFIGAGVRVVGGCCGTTPTHIQAIRRAARSLRVEPAKTTVSSCSDSSPAAEAAPQPGRSRLARLLFERKPVRIVELLPPRGVDARPTLDASRRLGQSGVDAILVSDGPRSSASMAGVALSILIERDAGTETILHYPCRDRGLLAMQSELLGAYALGLRNIFLTTGGPMRVGDYIDATSVAEVDSIGLTRLVSGLNSGRDLGGKGIGTPLGFHVGVSVNPSALGLAEEVRRLEQKILAGAQFAITEPVFRPELIEQLLERVRHLQIPIIASIRPFASREDAECLRNEFPGISVPDALVDRMQTANSQEGERREGMDIAREIASRVAGMVQGIALFGFDGDATDFEQILGPET